MRYDAACMHACIRRVLHACMPETQDALNSKRAPSTMRQQYFAISLSPGLQLSKLGSVINALSVIKIILKFISYAFILLSLFIYSTLQLSLNAFEKQVN